jgi:hypothetical protein
MWFWKKRGASVSPVRQEWLERERVLRRRISAWLAARARRLSPVRLRWMCFAFVLLAGLWYTWLLVEGLRGTSASPGVDSIRMVTPLGRAWRLGPRESLRRVLDSVQADPVLSRRWDSLLRVRPGLGDSVRRVLEGR